MISFIVTLLALSTINVDAQTIQNAYAIFEDENGHQFGSMEFEAFMERRRPVSRVEFPLPLTSSHELARVMYYFDFENMTSLDEGADDFQFFLHESCTGDVYQSESYNSSSNVNCTSNELGCIAGMNFTDGDGDSGSFVLNGVTVQDLVGLSIGIHRNGELVFCTVIYNMIQAEVLSRDSLNLNARFGGYMDDLYFEAGWNGEMQIDQILIFENPAIDGDCSTTGDIFNPAGHNRSCAYGNLTCELEEPDNDLHRTQLSSWIVSFNYMNAQTLFCGGERSLVIFAGNQAEPYFCGTFNFTNGPVICPTEDVDEEDVDEGSAIARGPYQGYFFAVVFCLCAFHF